MIDESLRNMCFPSSIRKLLAQDADENYIWELSPLFGRIDSEPILVNGPLGPIFYISRLRNSQGSRMCGHQIGKVIGGTSLNKRPLAVYELIGENNDSSPSDARIDVNPPGRAICRCREGAAAGS